MNFTEILDELGIPYRTEGDHHCRDGWIQLECPQCGLGSNKFHLGYNIAGHYMNCYKCGFQNIVTVLMESTGRPAHYIKSFLKGFDRVTPEIKKIVRKLTIPKGITDAPLHAHEMYLKERGFESNRLEALWRIGYIAQENFDYSWRIYIPIHYQSKVVSWTTRTISSNPQELRYKSAPAEWESIPHKTLLYGADYARHAIIVCEGPTDVWRIGPGAVATFGVGFTRAQLLKMSKYPTRVICYDSDPQAQNVAQQLCDQLEGFPGETINVVLDAKDAGEATFKEIKKLRRFL